MRRPPAFVLALLPAVGALARAGHAQAPPHGTPHRTSPARAAARASLLAADRAHAARSARSLTTGFPTALDRDVVLLYPGAPIVRGRAAAESLLRALPDAPKRALRWNAALAELSGDGLHGYTLGSGTSLAGDSADPVRYLAYWRRTAAGAWHVAAWGIARGSAARDLGPRGTPRGTARPSLDAPCASPTAGLLRPGTADITAQEIRAVDSAFAARSARDGAGPAFAATVAPDGLVVGGTPGMTCGPAAAGAVLSDFGPGALAWTPTVAEAAGSGDLGMTAGTETARAGGDTAYAKYLTVWRRGRDGTWRVAADVRDTPPSR